MARVESLFATMKSGERRILPVWHELEAAELHRYSPLMSDYLALRSRDGIEAIVRQVIAVCATGKG